MTKDTFVRIVKTVIEKRGVRLYASKEAKIAAIGREVEQRAIGFDEAAEKLSQALSDEYLLGRDDFKSIAKELKRHG